MTLKTVLVALNEAERCGQANDITGLGFFLNEAHCAFQAIRPQSGQAAHLMSVLDAYEQTDAISVINEMRA